MADELIGDIARIVRDRAHVAVRADHRHTLRDLDGIQRCPFGRVPAHVQQHALLVDLFDVLHAQPRQRHFRIETAAAEDVRVVVGDAHDPEAQLLVRAQIADHGLAVGVPEQAERRLPAGNVRDLALLFRLPDLPHGAGLNDLVRELVEQRQHLGEPREAADALMPAVHAASLQHLQILLGQRGAIESVDDERRALHLPRVRIFCWIDARHARCRDELLGRCTQRRRQCGRRQRRDEIVSAIH